MRIRQPNLYRSVAARNGRAPASPLEKPTAPGAHHVDQLHPPGYGPGNPVCCLFWDARPLLNPRHIRIVRRRHIEGDRGSFLYRRGRPRIAPPFDFSMPVCKKNARRPIVITGRIVNNSSSRYPATLISTMSCGPASRCPAGLTRMNRAFSRSSFKLTAPR